MSIVVNAYESWVRRNAFWFVPIVDTARSFTVFLPGRFNETELRSESIYSVLNLLGVYHDSITGVRGNAGRTAVVEYKTPLPGSASSVSRCKNILTFMMYTEVLTEAVARHLENTGVWADKPNNKWFVILAVEFIKSMCKLRLLAQNKGRMLVTPNPEESMYNSAVSEAERKIKESEIALPVDTPPHPFRDLKLLYAHHGRGLHPHGRFVLPPCHPRDRHDFRASKGEVMAEVLFHIRPLVYVVGRILCKSDSWAPFIGSLATDIVSRMLIPKFDTLSPSQQHELRRRSLLLMLYLIRSPMFDQYTSIPLNALFRIFGHVPVLGSTFGLLKATLEMLQRRYFHTAGSS